MEQARRRLFELIDKVQERNKDVPSEAIERGGRGGGRGGALAGTAQGRWAILEVAVAGETDYVVTGDGDLPAVGEWEGITIVTAAAFAAAVG